MVLPKIKEVISILKFAKKAFTKGGFRLAGIYINGIISLAKKTINKIAEASPEVKHQQKLNRILTEAKFEKELLEKRYFKKIRYLFRNSKIYLIFDDTLVERLGKHVEEAQYHYDHSTDSDIKGHQFFISVLYTPFLQLPLFPELYSKNTDSKIELAKGLIDKIEKSSIKIDTVLFDSWYSDEKIINKCKKLLKARVICGIKSNRNIRFKRSWKEYKLSFITDRIPLKDKSCFKIDREKYRVASYEVSLHKVRSVRLIISERYSETEKSWNKIHLISTNQNDSPEEIISTYKIRWNIETYHRDIKQNLGFAKAFLWKKEGIVRHSILVTIAYAILKLVMYRKGISMTIGKCIEYLNEKSTAGMVLEIVEIENKPLRLERFGEVFKRESEKV